MAWGNEVWIVVSIISTLGTIAGIQLLNRNWFKRKEMEYDYNIKRFKLGKKFKLEERELPKANQPSVTEQLKGVDINTIRQGLDLLQKKPVEEEDYIEIDEEASPPTIADAVMSYAEKNPEQVAKAMEIIGDKLKKPKEEEAFGGQT